MNLIGSIIHAKEKTINIVGVPGAGKTKLIENIARHEQDKKFLYLSFGKENTNNARKRMPKNVTCSSFHSLAKNYLNIDNKRLINKLTLGDANSALKSIGLPAKEAKALESFVILNSLFCMSGFTLRQIPSLIKANSKIFPVMNDNEVGILSMSYCRYWEMLWEEDKNIGLPLTHDIYFKAYSTCASPIPYDYLIVDEMQDLNNAMYSCINRLSDVSNNMTLIKLGDPCQQIYSFRGASTQFSSESFHYALDNSYRFGKKLCGLTNEFMSRQSIPYYTPIKSKTDQTQILNPQTIDELLVNIKNGQHPTFIARYNITLWQMIKTLALKGIICSINGHSEDELQFLQDLYKLSEGKPTNRPEFKKTSYNRYKQMARVNHDNTGILSCKFVESMKGEGELVFQIIRKHLTTISKANVLLTTVHQAKGLEFKDVIMLDDFPECWDTEASRFNKIQQEEAKVVYTAMTRAKNSLTIPRSWTIKNPESF